MLTEIAISGILIVALFINMYFTYILNKKMKALREYTKKLPDLISFVQKTMESFSKNLSELKESGGKITAEVKERVLAAEEISEDLRTLIQFADKRIKILENSANRSSQGKIQTFNNMKQHKNSILDLIDRD